MKFFTTFLFLIFISISLNCAQQPEKWKKLKNDIQEIISNSEGTVAIAFEDLVTGDTLFINEKIVMHAASTMKTPVMIEVFKQANHGKFDISDSLLIKNEFRSIVDNSLYSMNISEDSDDLIYKHLGKKMSIRDLVCQMITVSSNLSTNILIDLVDAKNVTKTMNEIGVYNIKVLRGVEDLKAYGRGLNNITDAFDLLLVMKAIALKQVVSPRACEEMIEILSQQVFRDKIPALLPPTVKIANKGGSITEIDHDSAIIYLTPNHPYVLVVLTKGIKDHKKAQDLIAQISKLIYDSFL